MRPYFFSAAMSNPAAGESTDTYYRRILRYC